MEMIIIYILLIIISLVILWHIFCNLMAVFHKSTTDLYVKNMLKDPYKYIRNEEMIHFFKNMAYLYFVVLLLLAACNGNIKIEKNIKPIETSIVKDK